MARSQEDRGTQGEEMREGRHGESPTNLDERSTDELRQMARDLGIVDRDAPDRDALIQAIQRDRGEERSSKGGPGGEVAGTGYTGSGGGQEQSDAGEARGERERQEKGRPTDESGRSERSTRQ